MILFVYFDNRTKKRIRSQKPLSGNRYTLITGPKNAKIGENDVLMKNGLVRRYSRIFKTGDKKREE